jgi:hypothetical protein
MRHN